MNSEDSPSGAAPHAPSQSVTLSPWVNERFPAWEQLLSAHDVARLTRRPRWVIASLVWVHRFPRKRRYHGRGIGWLRSDIVHWLARDLRAAVPADRHFSGPQPLSRQTSLPLQCTQPCTRRRRRLFSVHPD